MDCFALCRVIDNGMLIVGTLDLQVDCGAFIGARTYDTPSATVNTKFYYTLAGWAGFFALVAIIWATIKIVLHVRQPAYLLMHNARLQRAMVIVTQIIALPFGVSAFKVRILWLERKRER